MRTRHARRLGNERGQVLPFLLLAALAVMLACSAFAIDIGHAYLVKRQLRASSDAAALAGAQMLPDVNAAAATAADFGPTGKNPPQGVSSVTMTTATKCLKSAPGCSPANAIVVQETAQMSTYFAKLFGIGTIKISSTSTACSPCGQKPLDIMVVLDRTLSMCMSSNGKRDPGCTDLNNAKNGIRTFLGLLDPQQDHVGLAVLPPAKSVSERCNDPGFGNSYGSANYPYVIVPLSSDYLVNGQLNQSSDLVSTLDCVQADGSTAYALALEKAQAELVADGRPGVQKVIVLLSDGAANDGPSYYPATSPYLVTPCHQGITSSQTIQGNGTLVFTIGYDLQHDKCQGKDPKNGKWIPEKPAITAEQAMQGMASTASDFYNQPQPGQLDTIFTSVAAEVLYGHSKLVSNGA